MKAIICNDFAPLDQLEYGDWPEPEAGPGQVVIRNEAIGVNYPDGLLVQGLYQEKPPCPFVPGREVSGVIEAVGEGVTRLQVGDRVAAMPDTGYSEKSAAPATNVYPIPDSMTFADAAALNCAYGTSHHALKQRAQLQPGETLVVLGAAGATGVAAIQIGKIMGATVIAVASSEEKLAVAKASGADHLVNYSEVDLKAALKELTNKKGVDVVYDAVGGDAFDACTRCMAWGGRLLVIGFASGRIPQFPVNLALVKGYSVVGVFWGSFAMHQPDVFRDNVAELYQWYEEGKVKPHIDSEIPLADAVQGLQKVLGRQVKGKLILKP